MFGIFDACLSQCVGAQGKRDEEKTGELLVGVYDKPTTASKSTTASTDTAIAAPRVFVNPDMVAPGAGKSIVLCMLLAVSNFAFPENHNPPLAEVSGKAVILCPATDASKYLSLEARIQAWVKWMFQFVISTAHQDPVSYTVLKDLHAKMSKYKPPAKTGEELRLFADFCRDQLQG
ncbi:unnamed protein product [Amoebophrya sp. A120]|nr:unnamed protein product [Amoebophrya sp. A120]|eukprot:GSA120T00024891001.1